MLYTYKEHLAVTCANLVLENRYPSIELFTLCQFCSWLSGSIVSNTSLVIDYKVVGADSSSTFVYYTIFQVKFTDSQIRFIHSQIKFSLGQIKCLFCIIPESDQEHTHIIHFKSWVVTSEFVLALLGLCLQQPLWKFYRTATFPHAMT